MKNIIYSIIIFTLFCGCERFVQVDLPNDQLTKDLIFKDITLAKAAMAGVYRSLDERGYLSGSTLGGGIYLGCYADEQISYQSASSDLTQLYQCSLNPQSKLVKSLWETTYNQLYSVNAVLEGLERSSTLPETGKRQLRGEGLFIRALLHLYLSQTYGAVPYVTQTNFQVNQHIVKVPETTVYRLAAQDLDEATELLPATALKGQRIRPTKMASYALRARVALYAKDWENAVAFATKVLSDPSYKIESDLGKVFLKESSSAIWQLQSLNGQANAREGSTYILVSAPPNVVSLRPEFVNSFEPADLRVTRWIKSIKDSQQRTYFYPFKYQQRSTTATSMEYSVVLRTEELLLIRAEASLRLQRIDQTLQDLNQLRTRANLDILQTPSVELLSAAVLNERRHELFTEYGHRFFDLKRFGLLDVAMYAVKPQWKPIYNVFPLPESEILLNPNLAPQNNGYQ